MRASIYIVFSFFLSNTASGQTHFHLPDSLNLSAIRISHNKFINNVFQDALNAARQNPDDAIGFINGKAEKPYRKFEGKIIRNITIIPLNFDRNFKDTAKTDQSFWAVVGKKLHTVTKNSVVKNDLFFKLGDKVNAYQMADNERWLRSREYIQDARIVLKKVPHSKDSVDIVVYTKDEISIAGGLDIGGPQRSKLNVYESNFGGLAQRLDFMTLFDAKREGPWGFQGAYKKTNLFHSFCDLTITAGNIGVNGATNEEELSYRFLFEKSLHSPYDLFAGALSLSKNESINFYQLPESKFYKYNYVSCDAWLGYNFNHCQIKETEGKLRNRHFGSVRYFNRTFNELPFQTGNRYDPFYNNTTGILGQITFFNQEFYKTHYIYGFGTTEDVPIGLNTSLVAGWTKQLELARPYAGLNVSKYLVTEDGEFCRLFAKGGTYFHNGNMEDAGIMVGVMAYSRIYRPGKVKIRQLISLNAAAVFSPVTSTPLRINNSLGLRGFMSDSIFGDRRISLQSETVFYLKGKIFGFSFAPFPFADVSLLRDYNRNNYNLFAGLGGGMRARNEHLIFRTIELRAYYYPVAPVGYNDFKVVLSSNLNFRYQSSYINAPDLIDFNRD